MEIDSLYKKYKAAKNLDEIGACIVEALRLRRKISEPPNTLREIVHRGDILDYLTLKALGNGDGETAKFFAYESASYLQDLPKHSFLTEYLLARANYQTGDYVRAAKFFALYDMFRARGWNDIDELSFFYRANCLALQGRLEDALKIYAVALQTKLDFPEAKMNFETVRSGTNANLILEVSSLWNVADFWDVPIFINARDRLGVMKKLIDWLLDAGYRNVIILDNDSTYPPLLEYYSEIDKDPRVKIITLGENFGYKALWSSKVLEYLHIATPYVYTDPDVVPAENCPKDIVRRLYEILSANREIRKVGLGLIWEDITFYDKNYWQESEADFYARGNLGGGLAYANVDTTFALYSNTRSYSLRFSLRTVGDLRARHLPWYFDYDNLPEDEKYYLDHADKSFVTTVREKIQE